MPGRFNLAKKSSEHGFEEYLDENLVKQTHEERLKTHSLLKNSMNSSEEPSIDDQAVVEEKVGIFQLNSFRSGLTGLTQPMQREHESTLKDTSRTPVIVPEDASENKDLKMADAFARPDPTPDYSLYKQDHGNR